MTNESRIRELLNKNGWKIIWTAQEGRTPEVEIDCTESAVKELSQLLTPSQVDEKKECETCGGSGQEVVGEHRVTQDMATDAGDKSLEGMFHSYIYDTCSKCGGSGVEPTPKTDSREGKVFSDKNKDFEKWANEWLHDYGMFRRTALWEYYLQSKEIK